MSHQPSYTGLTSYSGARWSSRVSGPGDSKPATQHTWEAAHTHAATCTAEYEKYDKELKPAKDLGDAFLNELDEVDMEVRNLMEVRMQLLETLRYEVEWWYRWQSHNKVILEVTV